VRLFLPDPVGEERATTRVPAPRAFEDGLDDESGNSLGDVRPPYPKEGGFTGGARGIEGT
jgi:hypothetical protein